MRDTIYRQAQSDNGYSDGFADGYKRGLTDAQPDNQTNLCDSCDYSYPDCPSESDDVIFGNGIGNDNICACNKYMPSAQTEHKAPISYEEQLSLDCSFCRQHECGDTLYESSDWDGGIGFDYIRDIRFCPICGRELYGYKDAERLEE